MENALALPTKTVEEALHFIKDSNRAFIANISRH